MAQPYKRILIKLSGEAFADAGAGIDLNRMDEIAEKVAAVYRTGVQIALVTGAGNFWRGAAGAAKGMNRSTSDHIGMLGIIMNGLALQDALERQGVPARVQTAVPVENIVEPYVYEQAIRHMEKGRVVILSGGMGIPYFTTDSVAAVRAGEVNADIIIKATKVNGIYSDDPQKNPDAVRYEKISYDEIIAKRLKVMDMTAFTLCRENNMPILVLDFESEHDLMRGVQGDNSAGTLVTHTA